MSNNLTFFGYVSPDKQLREAGKACEERLEKFEVDLFMRVDLYKALSNYEVEESLDRESRRYVEKTLLAFERNGLKLSLEVREKITELQKRISEKQIQFSSN